MSMYAHYTSVEGMCSVDAVWVIVWLSMTEFPLILNGVNVNYFLSGHTYSWHSWEYINVLL